MVSFRGQCDELVINGSFAAGNTGFSSNYQFVADSIGNCVPAGVYTIGTDPSSCHSLWSSFGPYDPSGNMMIINGHPPQGGNLVWSETVSVVPNSIYAFSAYAAANYPASAILAFTVNGAQVGGNFTVNSNPGTWTKFSASWNSVMNTTAVLRIIQTGAGDFSLDDVSFSGPAPGTTVRSLPHFAAGGSFVTGIYVVNSGSLAANFSINFYDDSGMPAVLPFTSGASASMLAATIPAKGAAYYEAGHPQDPLLTGSAVLTAGSEITAQALFRRQTPDGNYFEAAVPSSAGSFEFEIPFDATTFPANGAPIYTGIAIANLDPVNAANVTCLSRDTLGNVIPNAVTVPALNPLGHWANFLFAALAGIRGTLDCSSNTRIGAIGVRALGASISSLPVISIR
jgi:hypothetical protein